MVLQKQRMLPMLAEEPLKAQRRQWRQLVQKQAASTERLPAMALTARHRLGQRKGDAWLERASTYVQTRRYGNCAIKTATGLINTGKRWAHDCYGGTSDCQRFCHAFWSFG